MKLECRLSRRTGWVF